MRTSFDNHVVTDTYEKEREREREREKDTEMKG